MILRATELESFVMCEARYAFHKQYNKSVAKISTLSIWKLLHLARQSKELAALMVRWAWLNIKERNIVNELIRHADRFPQPTAYEVEVAWNIEWVDIIWHIDEFIFNINKESKTLSVILIDNKTSSWAWDKEGFAVKLQRYIYSYLCHLNTGVTNINFMYRVFNKKSLITDKDIVEISEDMNIEECKTKLTKWVQRLKKAIETNDYTPNRCKNCFFCPYRTECKEKYSWLTDMRDIKFENEEELDF